MDNASFEYYDKIMKALLKLVRENEGIGSLEIRRAMCHKGLREGHIKLYVDEARRRGLIAYTVGARNKRHHYIVENSPKPVGDTVLV